jgi:hypothetical protein
MDNKIELLQEIDDARRSRVLLEKLLEERVKSLIDRLVCDYRGDKYNPDKALGAIAEIAGMKDQIDKLTRIIRGAG